MKKRLLLITILFIPMIVNAAGFSNNNYYENVCGLENVVPYAIPKITSTLFTLLKILVPVILVIMGMIDMLSAMSASSQDGMKKSQSRFITRIIAAVVVFLVMSIVQFAFNSSNVSDKSDLNKCMSCLLTNESCGSSNDRITETTKACFKYSYKKCPSKDENGNACKKNSELRTCEIKNCAKLNNSVECVRYSKTCTWNGSTCMKRPKQTVASQKQEKSQASEYDACHACDSAGSANDKKKCYESCQLSCASKCPSGGGGNGEARESCLNGCRNSLVSEAEKYQGHPYVWGGTKLCDEWNKVSGCGVDCSAFVREIYSRFGYSLPRTSAEQRAMTGVTVIPYSKGNYSNLKLGDVVLYQGHVALYAGNGQIVHASSPKVGIIKSSIDGGNVLKVSRVIK